MKTDLSRRAPLLLVSAVLLVVAAGASMARGRPRRRGRPRSGGPSPTSPAPTTTSSYATSGCPARSSASASAPPSARPAVLIQTLTRNPLAEPGILGVTAGAGFAINLGVLAGVDRVAGRAARARGGRRRPRRGRRSTPSGGPRRCGWSSPASRSAGVLMGVSLGLRLTFPDVFDRYRFWSVGALAGTEQTPLVLPVLVTVAALVAAMAATGPLNALALGEHVAHALGAHVTRIRVDRPGARHRCSPASPPPSPARSRSSA